MKKSRGQTLVEFVAIAILVLALLLFGVIKFGDKVADFFAGSDPGKRFNNARTVKFENPHDLLSNVSVTFDGITIEPPVEKVIKAGLAGGSYIQTSGSAGRLLELGKIMTEYVNEIQKITTTGAAGEANFINALDAFKEAFTNDSSNGYLDNHASFASEQILEQKLNLIKMAVEIEQGTIVSDLKNKSDTYIPNIPAGNRKDIILTFVSDLISFGEYIDYFMDPSLYVKYLGQDKKLNNAAQDRNLISAMRSDLGSLAQDEKLYLAGLIKIYYTGGYSQASSAAYNGERMCNTFGGTMISDTECEIPVP